MATHTLRGLFVAIADAIRAKTGASAGIVADNFPTAIAAIPTKETLSWHQCPEAVRHYLAYIAAHPYSDSDYTTTQILNYAPSTADQANSKPVGYTVDGVTFYDNKPLVAEPFSTANKAGTLTALDKLRWYNTTCAPASANDHYGLGYNCRDLGGWACDGGTVRYGMLVRSGELNPVDKELMVDTVGIKTEINLLPYNMQNDTHESVWGIERVANPGNSDFMYNISANLDQWKLYLGALFRSTAESKGVIFHCGAGADKTGTLAVMVMGMLGCSLSDIDADYELTTFSAYSDWRNRTFISYQNLINAIQAFPLESGLTDSFQNHCVSFALSLGFTADEINAFRVACIDGTPSTITAVEEAATYTNLFDPSADGYIAHGRCSSSGADRTDVQTCFVTNYIPVTNGDVVRIKGASVSTNYYSGVYNANKTGTGVQAGTGTQFANYAVADGVTSFTVNYTDAAYVRITCENADLSGVIVTVNEPI